MRHLLPGEFVDALEQRLAPTRRRHLAACDRCRRQFDALEQMQARLDDGGVPEPSPLFWEHFSRRVQEAVSVVPVERRTGWLSGWRIVAAGATVVVALLVGLTVRQAPRHAPQASAAAASEAAPVVNVIATDEDSLTFVAHVTSDVSLDELQQVARPAEDATDAMVAQLTPAERAEFVRLLRSGTETTQ